MYKIGDRVRYIGDDIRSRYIRYIGDDMRVVKHNQIYIIEYIKYTGNLFDKFNDCYISLKNISGYHKNNEFISLSEERKKKLSKLKNIDNK